MQEALLGCEYLDLWSTPFRHEPSCFDSQLLLRLAPSVRCLHLSSWSIKKQGIRNFVAAALNLTEVVMNVYQVDDAACADSILCASKSVLTLRSEGSEYNCYMPQELPQQLQHLEVLSMAVLVQKQGRAIAQPKFEAFLRVVCSMRHLRIVSLHCASLALRCSMSLPSLASLSLGLWVCHGTSLDLRWLHSQHHDQLHICLELERCLAETSQQCLSQLERFHISHLHLVVLEFPVASQQIWRTLDCCDSFHLELCGQKTFDAIHALPLCNWVKLTDARKMGYDWRTAEYLVPSPVVILWQALARSGRYHVCLHKERTRVQVEGFAHPLPDSLAAPWQLVLHAVAGVTGLPPSRPVCAPATYYLQNSAADAAGWESMSLDECHCTQLCRWHGL